MLPTCNSRTKRPRSEDEGEEDAAATTVSESSSKRLKMVSGPDKHVPVVGTGEKVYESRTKDTTGNRGWDGARTT